MNVRSTANSSFRATYCEVNVGNGNGTTNFQTIPGNTFTRIAFPNIVSDDGSNWSAGGSIYVCPNAGIYDINVILRIVDNSSSNINFGFSVFTTETDNPSFAWFIAPTAVSGSQRRSTSVYAKQSRQQKGDQLRAFTYFDGASGSISAASLTVRQVG